MNVGLLALAAVAVLMFGIVLGILSAPILKKGTTPQGPHKQEPWERALDDFMRASHGVNDPAVTRGMTYHITTSVRRLAAEVRDFNESTTRLGRVNLTLAFVLAVATVVYTVVFLLQWALHK
ncbi:MAG: hypothetical protein ABSC21_08580 [Terriglobia bacterium]|jgi:hypothetical protein